MKKFFIIAIFVIGALSEASDFAELDSALTEASRVSALTAKRKAAWAEEKARLEALEASYKSLLKAKLENVAELESEISKILGCSEPIAKKIKADEAYLKLISTRLNYFLGFLKSYPRVVEILKRESISLDNYETKSELEKLSLLCAAHAKLKTVDKCVFKNGEKFSTGELTVAAGKSDGLICVLTLEEGAKK